MTFDEYKTQILDLVEHPDTAAAKVQDFLKKVQEDRTAADSAVQKISDQDKRIRDLQDTNIALLLNQTGKRPHGDENEGDGHIHTREDVDKFFADLTAKAEKE